MLTIDKPPLKTFRIDFKFKKPEGITFDMMAKVENLIKKDYPDAPSFDIIEYPYDVQVKAKVPIQIGPIKFVNKEKNGQIQFFSDGLIFIFTEYTHWDNIKESIIDMVLEACKILKLDNIEQFRVEYNNEYSFDRRSFDLSKYFNLNVNIPEKWDINFNDFHIGMKIKTQEGDKFIIRLRGFPNKETDSFLFRSESIYLKKKNYSTNEKLILLDELDDVHEVMVKYFLGMMSEELKQILGVKWVD